MEGERGEAMVRAGRAIPRDMEYLFRSPSKRRRGINRYIDLSEASPWIIFPDRALDLKGRWKDLFQSPGPIEVDLGCGNGEFIAGLAARSRGINFLGIELKYKRLFKAAKRVLDAGLANLFMIRFDARFLHLLFAEGEVSAFYINFPDPWQKRRFRKKRLFTPEFAGRIRDILIKGGRVHLKTDYHGHIIDIRQILAPPLFEAGEVEVRVGGAGSPVPEPATRYERRFLQRGVPIYSIRFLRL